MSFPYWIVCETIIFKPSFDGSLENYSHIISNHKILYFSNYDDPYIALQNNNKYNYDILYKFVKSSFDHSLGNSLINLQEINLGHNFNHPLGDSLSKLINLKKLNFGVNFNRPLGNSLSKLVDLQELFLIIVLISC